MLPVIWTRGWSASCLACDSFSYIWSPPLHLQYGRPGFDPWIGKNPWRRAWQPTLVLLPGKSHGWRSLVGCSPWVRWESDMTERLHIHFSLSCIGEENGNPLQCSCLENPMDGGAWWAAVHGVAQSRTQLTWLSSSSSSHPKFNRNLIFSQPIYHWFHL